MAIGASSLLLLLCAVHSAGTAAAQDASPRNLDLFLLIGQSNMAGRGAVEFEDKQPIVGVYAWTQDDRWVPAVDPLHWDKPSIAGVGLGRSFARALQAANPARQIGLIPAAFGGTSLEEWKPGGVLYNTAVERARKAARAGRLRGILWHQGEAEIGSDALVKSYPDRFTQFIAALRQDLGAGEVPVILGEIGAFALPPRQALVKQLNQEFRSIPGRVPRSALVSAADLPDKGDHVHFDAPAQRELGRRYGAAFLRLAPEWKGAGQ